MCIALGCGPLAAGLLTEGRFADAGVRVLILLALGVAFAAGAFLTLRGVDARSTREAEARERSLRQARDQQAATVEILGAMAASPPDLQRVLETIARNAARVCDGPYGEVYRVDGNEIRLAAHHGLSATRIEALNQHFPRGRDADSPSGRAIRDGSVVHYADLSADQRVPEFVREIARAEGLRSVVVVPMLQDDRAIGTLNVTRPEGAFSERQIEFLRTFANQAVIAIENVRLFQELQTRNRELTETLARQTATAEILRVISSSPTDIQPVFDSIVTSANRLCDGMFSAVFRYDGELMHFVAHANFNPEALGVAQRAFPRPPTPDVAVGRAILERAVVHMSDVAQVSSQIFQRSLGYRSVLAVPMLTDGRPIGAIAVTREEPGPFADAHITLLQTFAAQAVMAIGNVRLFHDTKEALEQQIATGEILRVISSSPTNIQPVLDAVAESATRLCEADDVSIFRVDGDALRLAAHHGPIPQCPIGQTWSR